MKQRLLVAAIGVPLLIVVLVILPPVAAWILTAAIAAAAAWELLHTAGKHISPAVYALTMLMAVLTVLICARRPYSQANSAPDLALWLYAAGAYLFVIALFLFAVVTHGKEKALPFSSVAVRRRRRQEDIDTIMETVVKFFSTRILCVAWDGTLSWKNIGPAADFMSSGRRPGSSMRRIPGATPPPPP